MGINEIEKKFEDLVDLVTSTSNKMLSDAYLHGHTEEIAYRALETAVVGDTITIGKGVRAMKTKQDITHCNFAVTWEAGGEIARHSHDCIEVIFLKSGYLKDLATGRVIHEQDPYCFITEGEEHHIKSPQGISTADVLFKKPMI